VPEFSYKAVDETGRIVKGRLSAFDETDLEAKLSQKGLILVRVKKSKESFLLRLSKVSPRFVIEFYNRLYQAIEIGLPLLSALEEIAQGMPSKLFRKIIGDILIAVEAGNTLHDAMMRYPNIFSKLELNVIKMGEKSGTLPLCLKELAGFLEWKEETKSTIKRAMIYPCFVILLVSVVAGIWIGYVLPQMAKLLIDMGVKLPVTTMIILKASIFLKSYWNIIVVLIFAIFVGFMVFTKIPQGKKLFHKYVLKIPLIGNIIFNICLTRLCNNFAIMNKAGVSINEIFEILIDYSLGNRYLEDQLSIAFQHIQSGEHISEAFEKTGIFPRLFVGAVRNGEFTGTLDESFKRLAEYYDREGKNRVQALINALEPATMIILGGVFGVVALSILLPLYNLIGSLGKNY